MGGCIMDKEENKKLEIKKYNSLNDFVRENPDVLLDKSKDNYNTQFEVMIHGTSKKLMENIFNEGLQCKQEGDLSYTAAYASPIRADECTKKEFLLEKKLKEHSHNDSNSNFVLKLPRDFIIQGAREIRYAAFFVNNDKNKTLPILDTRFIVGMYDRDSGEFYLNPNFKDKLSKQERAELMFKKINEKKLYNSRRDAVFDMFWAKNEENNKREVEEDVVEINKDNSTNLVEEIDIGRQYDDWQ